MNFCKQTLLRCASWFGSAKSGKTLFYHDVHGEIAYTSMGTPLERFRSHVETICAAGLAISRNLPGTREIQITFDDGFRGIWDCRDFFLQNHLQPTVFLAVSLIGQPGYLASTEIRELQAQGFRFGSHTWSHQDLTQFAPTALRHELQDSKDFLEQLLQVPVPELCFPIGYFSDRVVQEACEAGYQFLYTSIPGSSGKSPAPPLYPRMLVQFLTPAELQWVLRGALAFFAPLYWRKHHR